MSIAYAIVYVVNQTGNFTIMLDKNLQEKQSIIVSPKSDFSIRPVKMVVDSLKYMDNITESWLPNDIDEIEGPHNGNNYLAYTFFVKNIGERETSYRTTIDILSVIKNVDDAIRVAVYLNGEKTVYAKRKPDTFEPEVGTVPFYKTNQVMNELRENFKVDEVDRYTVVVWLEGEDSECIDSILGGEMKMVMTIGEDRYD
ncbi:MAG: hypothetical protein MR550_00450 [Bacilli bacterium]|nr:hypothetical protein [Bacilli bacterium]